MTDHKIHDTIPSGFVRADAIQQARFEETGSINGAAKVALVDDGIGGSFVATRLRPPRTPSDVHSVARTTFPDLSVLTTAEIADVVLGYVREYNAGWAAGARGASEKWASGTSSHAWDDGYLDAAAGRAKWHLTWCDDHDQCGEG